LADAAIEEIAAGAEFLAELIDAVLRTFERADAAELYDRRNITRRVEKDLLGAFADLRVPDRGVAETQAGHRVRLAERVERNRLLVHARQRRDADVLAIEHDVLVGLV